MYNDRVPNHVQVLILGGGIHGVGVLHDLVSRGLSNVHLIEKTFVGSGTSSKSTKLIHGGLRYLQRVSQFKMVAESLKERDFLLKVAKDIVHPIEILAPITNYDFFSCIKLKLGLTLYDTLAGRYRIERHKTVGHQYLIKQAPVVNEKHILQTFSYWDAQTDDLSLVDRVAKSAAYLGGGITEKIEAIKLFRKKDKWLVLLKETSGKTVSISASCVVNCLGPWANTFLRTSGIVPPYEAFNNKGVHLLLKDMGLKSGLLLSNKKDARIVFVLPWFGKTLVGTTEEFFSGDPSQVSVGQKDVDYLLDVCNFYFKSPIKENDIQSSFAGLRWLAKEEKLNISSTARESILGETWAGKSLMLTLYGGKLTSYRSLSEKIGDRVNSFFGRSQRSGTKEKSKWLTI